MNQLAKTTAAVFFAGALLVSCTNSPYTEESPQLRVVTTVSPITSIVENIGGPRIHLEGLVPEGVNSHTFDPPPSVARTVSKADLIIVNGLFLEEPFLKIANANKKPSAIVLALANETLSSDQWTFDFSFPSSQGLPNPHLWTDPLLALEYAKLVRNELVKLDPSNSFYYQINYQLFSNRIMELDQNISDAIKSIPPSNRKLLTYHDSFPFFGLRYGLEIIGAVQPSAFTEPSAREIAHLIDQVVHLNVPAIFGSAGFSSKVMEQISRESGAKFVDGLRDDDLPGEPGDTRHTYLGLMLHNAKIIVSSLGGNPSPLSEFNPSLVFQEQSLAIYPQ